MCSVLQPEKDEARMYTLLYSNVFHRIRKSDKLRPLMVVGRKIAERMIYFANLSILTNHDSNHYYFSLF